MSKKIVQMSKKKIVQMSKKKIQIRAKKYSSNKKKNGVRSRERFLDKKIVQMRT